MGIANRSWISRGLAVMVGVAWLTIAPSAATQDECEDPGDCGFGQVCVSGVCSSCAEDPEQCNWYEFFSNLHDTFCDAQSGDCWENTDCGTWVGNPQAMACTPCNESGAMDCQFWEYCDTGTGICVIIPSEKS